MTLTITRRYVVIALIVIVVAAGAAFGGLQASKGSAGRATTTLPAVLQCSGKVQSKPTSYVLACADYNAELVKIHWTSWSSEVATARATYSFNNCTPYCAAGKFVSYPAIVKLSSPKKMKIGLLFTRVVVTYKTSAGKPASETEDLPTARLSAVPPTTVPVPVGSGYLATGSGYVLFIEWQKNGTAISGTAQDDYVNGTTPNEQVSTNTDTVIGNFDGSQISISFSGAADTFGTFSNNSFTLDFPQSDGSLVPAIFQAASADQFNQALATLQASVNSADAQTQQADNINQDESTISSDITTVDNTIAGLGQDSAAATASLGAFTNGLGTEKSDLATTASAERSVISEAKQASSDNVTVCDDAIGVADDATGVADDDVGVEDEAVSVEDAVTTVRNDIGNLQSNFAQLQTDEAVLPTYRPNAPAKADVNQAISSANKAINSAVKGANAAIDQANSYQTTAYQDAEGANNAGKCGTPPSVPETQQHIS